MTTTTTTRAHLEWEVNEMVSRLTSRDLTDSELAAMAEALRPAHARIVEGPTGGKPTLRLVPMEACKE